MDEIDYDYMDPIEIDGECRLRLNIKKTIPYTSHGFTLILESPVVSADVLSAVKLFYHSIGEFADFEGLKIIQRNLNFSIKNPSKKIHSVCAEDLFGSDTTCQSKAVNCRLQCKELIFVLYQRLIAYTSKSENITSETVVYFTTAERGKDVFRILSDNTCHIPKPLVIEFHANY